jgi:hypothetical protein
MADIYKVLESPYTALVFATVLGGLALSGKFTVTATHFLLAVAWVIIVIGLRGQPLPVCVGFGALAAGGLILLGYWFSPDAIPGYSGILYPKIDTLFSPKGGTKRILEFGDSGSQLMLSPDSPAGMPFFNFWGESNLTIEIIDGRLKVSTQIRDPSGDLVAELIRNEWKVAPPPKTWDRNYTSDALEVKNVGGRVVLQVRVLPDRIQLLGEWWGSAGQGVRFAKFKEPTTGQTGGMFVPLRRNANPDEPHIDPIFKYPSDSHFGELKVAP